MVIWDHLSRNPDLRSLHWERTFQTERQVQRPWWVCPCSPTPNTLDTGKGRREALAPIHRREGASALHSGKRNGSSGDYLWEDSGVWGPWRTSLQRLGSYHKKVKTVLWKTRVRKYPPWSQSPTVLLLQFGVWGYRFFSLCMFDFPIKILY